MSHYPTTYRDLTGNAAIEAMELADCRGSFGLPDDCNAEMDAAFGYGDAADELTEREIDALFVEEMERRDADAREVFGGNGGGDDDRTPPSGGALHLEDPEYWQAVAAHMDDDMLVRSTAVGDDNPAALKLEGDAQRQAFVSGFTSEILRRMDAMARKAA